MELRQLIYFMAIVEHQTMHAASEALLISQPALSRSLSNLEDELGSSSLIAKKSVWFLTKTGKWSCPISKESSKMYIS